MYEVKNLSFSYFLDQQEVKVLKNLNFTIKQGDFLCIQGPSGSGKSTLFYILGFLLRPTSGQIRFDHTEVTELTTDELTLIRNQRVGFVFQQFHLLSKANALENILLPTRYPSEFARSGPEENAKAIAFADRLGIQNHLSHFPNQLSGGQQQRVAIARALMQDVDLILADEPTGNLDSENASQILDLLTELNRQGKTIVIITHDPEVAKKCSTIYHLKDGAFVSEEELHTRNLPAPPNPSRKSRDQVHLPTTYSFRVYKNLAKSVFPLAIENLIRNKVKSLLTMLGVVIGVAAVLAMVTLGQFTKSKILESYENLGVNKILIRGYQNWQLKATDAVATNFNSFDWKRDLVHLKRVFPEIKYLSPVLESGQNNAGSGGIVIGEKVSSFGISPEHFIITRRKLHSGRYLSPFHLENRSPVCVIGWDVAKRLFVRSNPLGQIMTLNDGRNTSFPCQVIGVLESVTSNKEWSPPNLNIFLPYPYFQTVIGDWWASKIHQVSLQINPNVDIENVGKRIKAYFEQRYGKSGVFIVDSDSTLVSQMKRFLNLFSVLLGAIALVSLAVGGIGINNMMLVSVSERIKEFGIRKALGATHRSIRVQVLMESLVLCSAAGVLGLLVGFVTYELLIFGATQFVPQLKFEWVFEPAAILLSMVSIVTVGMISGLVPAIQAEKLQVIEALRTE